MTNKIIDLFSSGDKNILSVFFTAGYPKLDDTVAVATYLHDAGVDMIEIGIPFSDPIADGPVIQESNKMALDNGMTVMLLLKQVREIRRSVQIPIILMGYLNPVMQYGIEKFCKEASESGVDGLILPDLPMSEYQSEFKSVFEKYNLVNTFMISPTTSETRIRQIDAVTKGFIYAVSASSTTGAKGAFGAEQEDYFKKLQSLKLKNPFLIGFGISNHGTYLKACGYGSGAIIGSAFISMLKGSANLKTEIPNFVAGIRMDNKVKVN